MIAVFYYTKNSIVISKIRGKLSLYLGIAASYGYSINYSNDESIDFGDVDVGDLYFDGYVVKRKPAKPSDDAYWDSVTNAWAEDISYIRASSKSAINDGRLMTNSASFEFSGKSIACDALSRGDMDAINGLIILTGNFPAGFANQWKAIDNTYVSIPDIPTWTAFYSALVALGISTFQKSQTKKAAIDAATTIPAVKAITWDSVE